MSETQIYESVHEEHDTASSDETIFDAIDKSEYIKKSKTIKSKDSSSIKSLVSKELTQQETIRLGIAIEDVVREYIKMKCSSLIDCKEKNEKGIKEKDIIFKDKEYKYIIYAEMKSNIKLDTEKTTHTNNKIIDEKKALQKKYENYKICVYLIASRYLVKADIPNNLYKKFKSIEKSLVGIYEFIELFNIKPQLTTYEEYTKLLDTIIDRF
jgi:hypothetical protein